MSYEPARAGAPAPARGGARSADAARAAAADETREKLLVAAFEEMYRNGFQAAGLNTIVSKAGVTKGALYHHFPDKAALGLAVIDEVVRRPLLDAYLEPLAVAWDDPLTALQDVLRRRADDFAETGIDLGCPLNNMTQEMAPLDERFRACTGSVLDSWTEGFEEALERAKSAGTLRADVDAHRLARFLVASVEGSFGMAKAARSTDVLRANLETLADYLDSLRP
jgi:TetR/AcrR family transcriptional regulator, transcriptional repressor for nem operon